MLEYIICGDSTINIAIDDQMHVVSNSHPSYHLILEQLRKPKPDKKRVASLLSLRTACQAMVKGLRISKNGTATFRGMPVKHVILDKILEFARHGKDFKPLGRLLSNLLQNPSKQAIDPFYSFIEPHGFPITEEGLVVGYKSVRRDYMDWFTGTLDNTPGKLVEYDREKCDESRDSICSSGLHIGTLQYARGFHAGENRVVLVAYNPKDVVSVPADPTSFKLRVCRYVVLCDYESQEVLNDVLYQPSDGSSLTIREYLGKVPVELNEEILYEENDCV